MGGSGQVHQCIHCNLLRVSGDIGFIFPKTRYYLNGEVRIKSGGCTKKKIVITDEMFQNVIDNIKKKAHPMYGFDENRLNNPYGRAAFATSIEELYGIKMVDDVPTLEEINNLRGK